MSDVLDIPEFLTRDADGFLHFTGHRIGLHHVVREYNEGESPETLLDHFPSLSLSAVHRAIAFYLEHRAQLDDLFSRDEKEMLNQASRAPKHPDLTELRARFAAKRHREAL